MLEQAAGGGHANEYGNSPGFLGDANLTSRFVEMFRHSGDSRPYVARARHDQTFGLDDFIAFQHFEIVTHGNAPERSLDGSLSTGALFHPAGGCPSRQTEIEVRSPVMESPSRASPSRLTRRFAGGDGTIFQRDAASAMERTAIGLALRFKATSNADRFHLHALEPTPRSNAEHTDAHRRRLEQLDHVDCTVISPFGWTGMALRWLVWLIALGGRIWHDAPPITAPSRGHRFCGRFTTQSGCLRKWIAARMILEHPRAMTILITKE